MPGDEFLMKLQKARMAVEEYKRERFHEDYPPTGHLETQEVRQRSHDLTVAEKSTGSCAVCPYCGGSGKA